MTPFVSVLAWLFDVTLKASLLILLVAAIQAVAGRKLDARWRHLLWIVVLLRLLMPAAPQASWSLFNLLGDRAGVQPVAVVATDSIRATAATGSLAHVTSAMTGPSRIVTFWRWAFGVWAFGTLLMLTRLAVASFRTRRAVARALCREPYDASLHAIVGRERRVLGIAREVRIVETDLVRTPALFGIVRPVILLPRGVASSFTTEELRHVVLHELWHLRRLDVAVSWLLSAVQALHWFNPVVWFAAARIREERELACDELALSCLEDEERTGYGMTILKLLERFRAPAPVPALVGIVNEKQKMKRRLSMIASFRSRARLSVVLFLTVAAVGLVGLTDAVGGQHRILKEIDPASAATFEKLDDPVSFELTNATFGEVLAAISSRTGVTLTQAPELASNAVQQARFTLKADQVPAHAVLVESLMPFDLAPEPSADGVKIVAAPEGVIAHGHDGMHMMHAVIAAEEGAKVEKKVIVLAGPENGEEDMARAEAEAAAGAEDAGKVVIRRHASAEGEAGQVEKNVIVHRMKSEAEPDADGHIRRQLNFKMDENGVVTEGKLTLDIATK